MVFTGFNILYYLYNKKFNKGKSIFLDIDKFNKGFYLVKERMNTLRNFSFRVFELNDQEKIDHSLYFIKQVKSFDKINLLNIDAEARALKDFSNSSISKFIPELLNSDYYNGCIILKHIDGELLYEFVFNSQRNIGIENDTRKKWRIIFPIVSEILASLHEQNIKVNFPEFSPPILQLTQEFLKNLTKIRELKGGFVTNQNLPNQNVINYLIKILPLLSKINYVKDSIIHRDAHSKNFILDVENSIKLVDWELVSIGDKYWDVAKVLGSFIQNNVGIGSKPSPKLDFKKEIIKLIWDEYHKKGSFTKNTNSAIKVVNFILLDMLEIKLAEIMSGEIVDEKSIINLYESLKKPEKFQQNNINLYEVLTNS